MKLQDQVCSLELSKRLKELGVPQDSYWSWVTRKARKYSSEADDTYLLESKNSYNFHKKGLCWSAFTVAELGAMLPGIITQNGIRYRLECYKGTVLNALGFTASYINLPSRDYINYISGDNTEANARAKMLIWLIENGHISAEEQ